MVKLECTDFDPWLSDELENQGFSLHASKAGWFTKVRIAAQRAGWRFLERHLLVRGSLERPKFLLFLGQNHEATTSFRVEGSFSAVTAF